MRRKIPTKKHRGVKDPEKQQERRLERIKHQINQPPRDVNEQAIPKRALELKELIEKTKNKKPTKRTSKLHKNKDLIDTSKFQEREVILPGMRRPEKPVPVFKQLPGEQPHQLMYRIQRKCQEVINECSFEDKFNVNVKRNIDTGEVEEIVKVSKNDIAFYKHLKSSSKTEKQPRGVRKREKLKQKRKEKESAKQEKRMDDFAQFKDEVKFGEVAHEPPQLNILSKKYSQENAEKPGRRNLLLKNLITPPQNNSVKHPSVFDKQTSGVAKKKKKSKLAPAEQRQRETLRLGAVQAYRLLKAKQAATANGKKIM